MAIYNNLYSSISQDIPTVSSADCKLNDKNELNFCVTNKPGILTLARTRSRYFELSNEKIEIITLSSLSLFCTEHANK